MSPRKLTTSRWPRRGRLQLHRTMSKPREVLADTFVYGTEQPKPAIFAEDGSFDVYRCHAFGCSIAVARSVLCMQTRLVGVDLHHYIVLKPSFRLHTFSLCLFRLLACENALSHHCRTIVAPFPPRRRSHPRSPMPRGFCICPIDYFLCGCSLHGQPGVGPFKRMDHSRSGLFKQPCPLV